MRKNRFLNGGGLPVLLVAAVLILAGCSSIPSRHAESFSSGVTAVRNQTALAFQGVTDLTSEAMVEFAVRQPTLNDESVLFVLDPDSVAAWDRIFAALEDYSQALVLLTSPNLAGEYGKSVAGLGNKIKQTAADLKEVKAAAGRSELFTSLSVAFTKLGDVLLGSRTQSDAREILMATDPTVRGIFLQMAEAIDPGERQGIRGTAYRHWNERKGQLTADFVGTADLSKKRQWVREYADLMNQQQIQDQVWNSLRRSLLSLAAAHHALANGERAEVAAAVAIVEQEARNVEELSRKSKSFSRGRTKDIDP